MRGPATGRPASAGNGYSRKRVARPYRAHGFNRIRVSAAVIDERLDGPDRIAPIAISEPHDARRRRSPRLRRYRHDDRLGRPTSPEIQPIQDRPSTRPASGTYSRTPTLTRAGDTDSTDKVVTPAGTVTVN